MIKTKWAIVTDSQFVTRNGKLAWSYDKVEADSWAQAIAGSQVVDGEKFLRELNAKNISEHMEMRSRGGV